MVIWISTLGCNSRSRPHLLSALSSSFMLNNECANSCCLSATGGHKQCGGAALNAQPVRIAWADQINVLYCSRDALLSSAFYHPLIFMLAASNQPQSWFVGICQLLSTVCGSNQAHAGRLLLKVTQHGHSFKSCKVPSEKLLKGLGGMNVNTCIQAQDGLGLSPPLPASLQA